MLPLFATVLPHLAVLARVSKVMAAIIAAVLRHL